MARVIFMVGPAPQPGPTVWAKAAPHEVLSTEHDDRLNVCPKCRSSTDARWGEWREWDSLTAGVVRARGARFHCWTCREMIVCEQYGSLFPITPLIDRSATWVG